MAQEKQQTARPWDRRVVALGQEVINQGKFVADSRKNFLADLLGRPTATAGQAAAVMIAWIETFCRPQQTKFVEGWDVVMAFKEARQKAAGGTVDYKAIRKRIITAAMNGPAPRRPQQAQQSAPVGTQVADPFAAPAEAAEPAETEETSDGFWAGTN